MSKLDELLDRWVAEHPDLVATIRPRIIGPRLPFPDEVPTDPLELRHEDCGGVWAVDRSELRSTCTRCGSVRDITFDPDGRPLAGPWIQGVR